MQTPISGDLVKNAGAISWSEVDSREAALIERCTAGDEAACAELVADAPADGLLPGPAPAAATATKRSTSRRKSSSASSAPSRASAASPPSAPGSTASSSTRRATASAGGGGATAASQVSLDEHLQQCGDLESKGDVLPDRLLASKETAARIWQALDRLPFDQRTALILREIDGLRYEEIAFSLGVAVGTVKSRLTRARQALRAELLGLRT